MRLKFIAVALLILICVLPGSKAGFFNGFPLSAWETVLAISAFIAIGFTPWPKIKYLKIFLPLCLSILLFFQVLSFWFIPEGWNVCLSSSSSLTALASKCEASLEDPRGETGFNFSDLRFNSKNLPLYFFNNAASFGYYRKGEPSRNSLPFNLEASAFIFPEKKENLILVSNKEIGVNINDKKYLYSPVQNEMAFPLEPNKINKIEIKYNSKIDKDNILEIQTKSEPFYKAPQKYFVLLALFYKLANYFLLLAMAVCLIYSLSLLFSELDKKNKIFILIFATSLILLAFLLKYKIFKPKELLFVFSLITFSTPLVFIAAKDIVRKKLLPFIFLVTLAASGILVSAKIGPEEAVIFPGGYDELSHETFSRQFIPATDFQKFLDAPGKVLFYYQPLHRYFLFLLHKFFGEPMWGPYLIQLFLFSSAIFFVIYALAKYFGLIAALSFSALSFKFYTDSIGSFILSPLQQALALPLFLVSAALIFLIFKNKKTSNKFIITLGLLLGSVFMIRTDWFPAVLAFLFLAACALWTESKGRAKIAKLAFLLMGFVVFPLLIGFRNYDSAGQFAIFPTSSYVNLNKNIQKTVAGKVEFYESSGGKMIKEIVGSYRGKYGELGQILWDNANQNIIGKSIWQELLWLGMLFFSAMGILFSAKNKKLTTLMIQLTLLFSLLAMAFIGSFFKMHNDSAMKSIYEFLAVIILAINIQIVLKSSELFKLQYLKAQIFLRSLKIKYISNKLSRNGISQ